MIIDYQLLIVILGENMTTTALRAVKSMGLKLREIRHSQVAEIIECASTMVFTLLLPYFIIAMSM